MLDVNDFDQLKIGLAVDVLNEEEEEVAFLEDLSATDSIPSMDIHLSGFERGDIE